MRWMRSLKLLSADSSNRNFKDETCNFALSKSLVGGSINVCKTRFLDFMQTKHIIQGSGFSIVPKTQTRMIVSVKPNNSTVATHIGEIEDAQYLAVEDYLPTMPIMKQDESLLEGLWICLRAGRSEEAHNLSAGQPWRSATLCLFEPLDLFPSTEALIINGKNRSLQAIELESGIGHQWLLWKWASYCVLEEIAEQEDGKYETAAYASQCINLKSILPICTDWEHGVAAMPIGAHTLLSLLAELLKQSTKSLLSTVDHDVSENLREFQDWSEYYSCEATYWNWLKIELEIAEVPHLELSFEEKERVAATARETLTSSLSLLQRREMPWSVPTQDLVYECTELVFPVLHATAMLYLPSGEWMAPHANLSTALMSALYSSVTEEEAVNCQLMVNVSGDRPMHPVPGSAGLSVLGTALNPMQWTMGQMGSPKLMAGMNTHMNQQQPQQNETNSPLQAVVPPQQVGSLSNMGITQPINQQIQQQQQQASLQQMNQRTPISPQLRSGTMHTISAGNPKACPAIPQLSSQTLSSVSSITNFPMEQQGVNNA